MMALVLLFSYASSFHHPYPLLRLPQKVHHTERPRCFSRLMYCRLARNSSIAGPIINTEMIADPRQSVHQESNIPAAR